MSKQKYVVAQILLNEDGEYWLRWYGTHPDQGGLTERMGEMGFYSIDDLATSGIHLMMAHDTAELWMNKIREFNAKKQKEEIKDGSAVPEGNEGVKVQVTEDWDPQH